MSEISKLKKKVKLSFAYGILASVIAGILLSAGNSIIESYTSSPPTEGTSLNENQTPET